MPKLESSVSEILVAIINLPFLSLAVLIFDLSLSILAEMLKTKLNGASLDGFPGFA